MKKFSICLTLLLIIFPKILLSKPIGFETARLKSTAGTGVASLLMDEATILNPASLAFFRISSIYVQKSKSKEINTESIQSDSNGFIFSDAKNWLKGSISHFENKNQNYIRKQNSIALAYPMGKRGGFGVSYKKSLIKENNLSKTYKQFMFGVLHVLSSNFTIGITVNDPQKKNAEDTMITTGFQYVYKDFISLMLDIGGDYSNNISKTSFYRTAIQLKMYKQIFLRAGKFYEKKSGENSLGLGLGWVQPRLVVDFSIKTSNEKMVDSLSLEEIKETIVSISYRF